MHTTLNVFGSIFLYKKNYFEEKKVNERFGEFFLKSKDPMKLSVVRIN